MNASQARAELAEVIINGGGTADETVFEVFDKLAEIRGALPEAAVHDSAEFLEWLRS